MQFWTFAYDEIIPDWRTISQALLLAYILHKCFQMKYITAFTIMICFLRWETIGVTVFAMYIVHQIFMRNKDTAKGAGRAIGYSNSDTPAVPLVSNHLYRTREYDGNRNTIIYTAKLDAAKLDEAKQDAAKLDEAKQDATKQDATPLKTEAEQPRLSPKPKKIKKKIKTASRSSTAPHSSDTRATEETTQDPPPLQSKTNHPGLNSFHQWMGAVSDMYRQYTIEKIVQDCAIPILPRSERGQVRLRMRVQNKTSSDIDVFWINYKGKESLKGTITSSGDIDITTWVGHPWAFRERDTGKLMLYFVPYRIIPVLESQYNSNEDHADTIGEHRFSIVTSKSVEDMCAVQDDLFPYPPSNITSINHALEFSIQQMEREKVSPRMLLKYICNIALHPGESKYRQIRVANKVFWSNIWCNGGRGVLQALGFEEHGPYIEMGPDSVNLPGERVKEVSSAIVMLEEFMKDMEDTQKPEIHQPRGADGAGRAGWRM